MKDKIRRIGAFAMAVMLTMGSLSFSGGTVLAATSSDLEEGEMCLQKKAEPVPGKVNTWRVTVTAECKDKTKPKDYILVIDKSESMMKNKDGVKQATENDSTRISLAKNAAQDLVSGIYEKDDRSRVAVLSFSSAPTTDIDIHNGDYLTGKHTKLEIDFTGASGENDVNNAIKRIEATGGTYTQLALHEAQEMAKAAHDADRREERERIIILLTDGLPTLSTSIDWEKAGDGALTRANVDKYVIDGVKESTTGVKYYINPDTNEAVNGTKVPAGATWEPYYAPSFGKLNADKTYISVPDALTTTENIPEAAFNYDTARTHTFGNGVDTRYVKVEGEEKDGEQIYVNTLNSTIAETNFIREKGDVKDLYVIGYDVSAAEANSIKKLAGDDSHFVEAKGTNVADAMQKILERTSVPTYEASVTDAIPVGFTKPEEIEVSCGTTSFQDGVLTWDVGTPDGIKEGTDPIERYATLSYTISVDDGHAFGAEELFQTNGDTAIEYNNPKWPGDPDSPEPKRTSSDVASPEVAVAKIRVKKTVVNNEDCEREFTIRVTDPKDRLFRFKLKHNDTDFTTKFTEPGTYHIVEMIDANGYEVNYKVNGQEANTFVINEVTDVQTAQIVNIEIENTAKAYNESYEFQSATPGEELPQAVKDLLPTGRTGLLTDTTWDAIQPVQTEVVIDVNHTWKFLGYDQDSKTVEGADIKFVGQWVLEYTPTYDVNYEYVSGTPGKDLPEEIINWTPDSVLDLREGETEDAEQPQQNEFKVDGGKWVFEGYNKDSVTITNSDEVFVGTWTYVEDPHNVTYEYQSAVDGVELPEEIKNLTPPDDTDLINGTIVNAAQPMKTTVVVEDGTWTFNGYGDKDSVTIAGKDEHFIGTWDYTPNPHKALYEFESGTPGKNLPDEVLALLPSDNNTYVSGNEVTAIAPEKTEVPVTGGKWVFQNYDSNTKTVDGADVQFKGVWVFEEAVYQVTYEYESATPGKELPDSIRNMTPETVSDLADGENVDAEAPAQPEVPDGDGKWVFKGYDKDSVTINGADEQFLGKWEYIANEHKASYTFVSGTEGKELPDAVKDLLPNDGTSYVDGDKVTSIKPEKTQVKVPGGKWVFKKYDSDEKMIEGGDVNFEGVWVFEEDTPASPDDPGKDDPDPTDPGKNDPGKNDPGKNDPKEPSGEASKPESGKTAGKGTGAVNTGDHSNLQGWLMLCLAAAGAACVLEVRRRKTEK